MNDFWLHFLDIFFLIFHSILILFNLFGWIFKKTRKLHLATVFLTLFSWLILGIWYGFGFCFCTEWHWQVRYSLGKIPTQASYVQFLVTEITGWDPGYQLAANLTWVLFAAAILAAAFVNIRDLVRYIKKKK